jgi:HEAT repeat protein
MLKRYIIMASLATLPVFGLPGPAFASTAEMDDLSRQYYLAAEGERPVVLEEIKDLGTGEALEFTLELLRYPDVKVKREAVDVLKDWGREGFDAIFSGLDDPEIDWMCESIFIELGPRAVPFLIEKLENEDPLVRGRSAYILGVIGDVIAVGPLYNLLKDPSRDVRIQVIQALCDLGDEQSMTRILELFELEDVGLGDFVLQAAERFGPRASASLTVALKSSQVRVRSGAALALGRIKVPETLPDLFDSLEDPEPIVRRCVVQALRQFKSMSAAEGLVRAMADEDLEVQEYATTALAELAPGIIPFLIELLSYEDPMVRKNAIAALRKTGDESAIDHIIESLQDEDINVRMFAVTALMKYKDPRAIKPLINRLREDDSIGWLLSYAFMEMGSEAVEELLLAVGDSEFCATRDLVILRMGDRAIETLHRWALEGEGSVRLNAIALLGDMANDESIKVLDSLLSDPDVGWVAANSLGRAGPGAWEPVLKHLSEQGIVRENALKAISNFDHFSLRLQMVEFLTSPDDQLRKAVAAPLVKAGAPVVPLIAERMNIMTQEQFFGATEILCRINDPRADKALKAIMVPPAGERGVLYGDRLNALKQAYAQKGSLDSVRKRLRREFSVRVRLKK